MNDLPQSKKPSSKIVDGDAGKAAQAPDGKTAEKPKEFGGRDGPEPTRYGDWENKGIISDF